LGFAVGLGLAGVLAVAFGGVAGVPVPAPRSPQSSLPSLHSFTPVTAVGVSADAGPVPTAKNTMAPADNVADAAPTRRQSRFNAISLPFDGLY
jgi:hypothetical protein